ncbi:class I SAM-dependent methyltransferase [Amycolatopsis sp. AA4]|uniref:class I SAM-dependent methyltransferase n=1 Tax=Actinomycetes TaxID=1760 RepID=UPI0001B57AB1|nr:MULTISPECIES: class I SAM-dependent methyltransferase [Actinomycetes]ATY11866.1 class I SAM-dependent methyltransferase [Amycolatopsis sp. AA4]
MEGPSSLARRAGTRDDPYAQMREARKQPLLLHSMAVFREIFEVVFAHREIRSVVEVGVESGQVSGMYVELGAKAVYCVDPGATAQLRATLAENPALHLVTTPSPEVLPELPVADLYVLDGDHNYAVVERELSWIFDNAPDAVVVMHDLLWPCARRDLYYEPSPLAPEDKHATSADGPTAWHDELTPAGFVGAGAFTVAQHAGGERNGVATAVEDVLARPGNEQWRFGLVPAVFGMGVLYRAADQGLEDALRPYTESDLLATMENNRVALYTRVLQMQYEAAAQAGHADQLAETVSAQRREIDRLNAELHRAWEALRIHR